MPAPAAVYIIVAVVGAAAATFAFKEFVYEPHLSGKFEEFRIHARAFWRKRTVREQVRRAQPFQSTTDSSEDDDDHGDVNAVELEGLLKTHNDSPTSTSGEMRLRKNVGAASITAIGTGISPPVSKTTGIDTGLAQHGDRVIVAPLIDLSETYPQAVYELQTPSEPSATITTPSNPFLDQSLVWLNVEPTLETSAAPLSPQQKTIRSLSPSSRSDSPPSSPLSHTYSLGVESPLVFSPMTSPQPQSRAIVSGTSSPNPSSLGNVWETVQRVVSPVGTDLGSPVSSWISAEPVPDPEWDTPNPTVSPPTNHPPEPNSHVLVPSLETIWAEDDDAASDSSFATDSTSLSSTFTSSIGSQSEGVVAEGPEPFLDDNHIEGIERPTSSLSGAEWERFSDTDH